MSYQIIRPSNNDDVIGGRVKSASIALGKILSLNDIGEIDQFLINITKGKDKLSNLSRFPDSEPSMYGALKKSPLRAFGKTDQGMPGNFYPFLINANSNIDLTFEFESERFEAIIEPRYKDIISPIIHNDIVALLRNNHLSDAYNILINLAPIEKVGKKGRNPFFICRPAQTDSMITLPECIVDIVEQKVTELLHKGSYIAANLAKQYKCNGRIDYNEFHLKQEEGLTDIEGYEKSIVYFQVDALIDKEGNIDIEKVNLPDVGCWFLDTFSDSGSLKEIKEINRNVRRFIIDKIDKMGLKKLTFITRSDVINRKEDLLEIRELDVIQKDLYNIGIEVNIISPDQIQNNKGPFFLMNIDYHEEEGSILLANAIKNPGNFYPNPFMQIAMNQLSGFRSYHVSKQRNEKQFNQLISLFKENAKEPYEQVKKIEQIFSNLFGFDTNKHKLYYIKNPFNHSSFIPVLINSPFSLRKIEPFLNKEKIDSFDVFEVPFENGKQRLQKEGHDTLHLYRFTGLSS